MGNPPSHPVANYVTRRTRAGLADESTNVLAARLELLVGRPRLAFTWGTWHKRTHRGAKAPSSASPRSRHQP